MQFGHLTGGITSADDVDATVEDGHGRERVGLRKDVERASVVRLVWEPVEEGDGDDGHQRCSQEIRSDEWGIAHGSGRTCEGTSFDDHTDQLVYDSAGRLSKLFLPRELLG